MTWENQLNKSEREYFTEIDVVLCVIDELQRETEDLRNKKRKTSQKEQTHSVPVKTKEQIAEDMLRSLL